MDSGGVMEPLNPTPVQVIPVNAYDEGRGIAAIAHQQGRMRIAFIVQRYGLDLGGGAELHCRWVAEHLSKYYDVEVLTTCAQDYITWRNAFQEGEETINNVLVRRFKVAQERDPKVFGRISRRIFRLFHTKRGELKWLKLQGPYAPALLDFLLQHEAYYDLFIFFSYRYWLSYHGVMRFPQKSLLVPTAEHDPTIYLKIFKRFFHKPRAIIYNSIEEKALINLVCSNQALPGDIVGVGIDIPKSYDPEGFRKQYGISSDYVIYIGRIDPNKGCREMFDYFLTFVAQRPSSPVKLVLIGREVMPVPKHEKIMHLGFVSDEDKFSALAGARFMIMPSLYESLSIVTLEAWSLSKPLLVNGRCEVLKGQCQRSGGGLYYHTYEEFVSCMDEMLQHTSAMEQLGRNGKAYVQANYRWEMIEKKYGELISRAVCGGPSTS
jgi:glycosyltransferase involved in cell wall biosynthesis